MKHPLVRGSFFLQQESPLVWQFWRKFAQDKLISFSVFRIPLLLIPENSSIPSSQASLLVYAISKSMLEAFLLALKPLVTIPNSQSHIAISKSNPPISVWDAKKFFSEEHSKIFVAINVSFLSFLFFFFFYYRLVNYKILWG